MECVEPEQYLFGKIQGQLLCTSRAWIKTVTLGRHLVKLYVKA